MDVSTIASRTNYLTRRNLIPLFNVRSIARFFFTSKRWTLDKNWRRGGEERAIAAHLGKFNLVAETKRGWGSRKKREEMESYRSVFRAWRAQLPTKGGKRNNCELGSCDWQGMRRGNYVSFFFPFSFQPIFGSMLAIVNCDWKGGRFGLWNWNSLCRTRDYSNRKGII